MAQKPTRTDKDLNAAINAVDKHYSAGSTEWFDYLAQDALVYSVSSSEPFKGRAAYRKHFERILTANKRKLDVLARDVHVFDDKAVVAQTVAIRQEDILSNVRQSVVWRRDGDRWQMAHIHTTIIGSPQPAEGGPARTAAAVRVLNEKIATVAAVLGVAQ